MKAKAAPAANEAPAKISRRIQELRGGRGPRLAQVRQLIQDAAPMIVDECKWRGTPVGSHDGIACTGESYKEVVKLTFARGASLPDPHPLCNSSREGNVRRGIDFRDGDKVNIPALRKLVQAPVSAHIVVAKQRAATKK